MRSKPCVSLALLFAACTALCANRAQAQKRSGSKVYERVLHSTALVLTKTGGGGTAWVYDTKRKLVISNHHVVEGQEEVGVLFPAYRGGKVIAEWDHNLKRSFITAKVLDSDPNRDLALLQLASMPADVLPLSLAPASPDPGARLHLVGNPSASAGLWVYATGTVRQVVFQLAHLGSFTIRARVITSSLPANKGDSGGPVVNDECQLVGVNSFGDDKARLMTGHINVTEVRAFLDAALPLLDPTTVTAAALMGGDIGSS